MTTQSSNKSKKTLIALGVILALGAIAWGGTTYSIKNKVNGQLEDFIAQTNQTIASNNYFVLKPKVSLKQLTSSFSQTDFLISVEIENLNKAHLKSEVIEIKNDLESEYSYYEESDLKAAEEQLAQAPDFIHLFDIENVAKHGPFPNISQFDFSLGLLDIESAISYKNINPVAIQFLKNLSTDPALPSQLETHHYLTGKTSVAFDNSIDSTLTSAPFNVVLDKVDSQIKFDGLKTHFNGTVNAFDLQTQIAKLDFITLHKLTEEKPQPQSQIDQKPTVSLGGMDLKLNYQAADIADVTYELTIHPLHFVTPNLEFQESGYKNEFIFDGLSANYTRKLNSDNETFLDKGLLTFNTIKINLTEPIYLHTGDEDYEDVPKDTRFEITPITLTAQMDQTPKALYIASNEYSAQVLGNIRKLIDEGDINAFILNDQKGMKEELNQHLNFYRNLVGELKMKSSPFDISYLEVMDPDNATFKKDVITNIGNVTINVGKTSTEATNPLTVDFLLDSVKSQYQTSGSEETPYNINVALKNLGTKASISLNQINPLSFSASLEDLSVISNKSHLLGLNNLAYEMGLTREENTADFYDGISANNIKVRGLEIGDYKARYTLANINQSALDTYTNLLVKLSDVSNQDELGLSEFNIIEKEVKLALNQLLSKELEFTLSPLHISNSTGKADLSFSVKMKPTTFEEVLAYSEDSFDAIDLVDNISFDLTTDIALLADVGSKVTVIAQTPLKQEINTNELTQLKQQFSDMIPLPFSITPLDRLFNINDSQIKSTIKFDGVKFDVNGEKMSLDEIIGLLQF